MRKCGWDWLLHHFLNNYNLIIYKAYNRYLFYQAHTFFVLSQQGLQIELNIFLFQSAHFQKKNCKYD